MEAGAFGSRERKGTESVGGIRQARRFATSHAVYDELDARTAVRRSHDMMQAPAQLSSWNDADATEERRKMMVPTV